MNTPISSHPALTTLLAPQHHPATPYHVYTLSGGTYHVRAYQADAPFPDFWWTTPGRVIAAHALPAQITGLHSIVTFFQFNAHRDHIFQTAHINGDTIRIHAREATLDAALAQHAALREQLTRTLPRDTTHTYPDWL